MILPVVLGGTLLLALGKRKRKVTFKADPVFASTKKRGKRLKPSDLYKK